VWVPPLVALLLLLLAMLVLPPEIVTPRIYGW
jgi:hypothetical protein